MARTNIPVTPISLAGVAPAAQVTGDNVNNHELASNQGNVILEVVNTDSGEARKFTIQTPGQVGGVNVEEDVVSVPLSATRFVKVPASQVVNQSTGKVNIDVPDTKLKFRAFSIS